LKGKLCRSVLGGVLNNARSLLGGPGKMRLARLSQESAEAHRKRLSELTEFVSCYSGDNVSLLITGSKSGWKLRGMPSAQDNNIV